MFKNVTNKIKPQNNMAYTNKYRSVNFIVHAPRSLFWMDSTKVQFWPEGENQFETVMEVVEKCGTSIDEDEEDGQNYKHR